MHIIRPICNAESARSRPQPRKWEIIRDAPASMRLDCSVQHLQHCGRCQHLRGRNFAPCLCTERFAQPLGTDRQGKTQTLHGNCATLYAF